MKKIIVLSLLLNLYACTIQRDLPSDCFYGVIPLDSVSFYKIKRLKLNHYAQLDSNYTQILYISDDPELEQVSNYRVWIFYDNKMFHWFLFDGVGHLQKTLIKPIEKVSSINHLLELAVFLKRESVYRIRDYYYMAGGIHANLYLFHGPQLKAGFESVGYSCAIRDEKQVSAKATELTQKILKLSSRFLNEK